MVEIIDFRKAQASRVPPNLDGRIRQIIDERIAAEPCTEQAEELTPRERRRQEREMAPPPTETAANSRLRNKRKDSWREAECLTNYWRARLRFEDAVQWVQRWDLPVGRLHPPVAENDRMRMVQSWRDAIVKQLLTPAPDARAIAWKKAALAAGDHRYTDVKTERIERAMAEDVAFLNAHPTRNSKPVQP